jgi:hypothetical protein
VSRSRRCVARDHPACCAVVSRADQWLSSARAEKETSITTPLVESDIATYSEYPPDTSPSKYVVRS